jgi:PAP2 superfamily protein
MHAVRDASTQGRNASRMSRLRDRFTSNWVLELSVLLALAVAYDVVRSLPRTTPSIAVAHARAVLSAEGGLFHDIEVPLNRWVNGLPWLAIFACYVYAVLHYVVTPLIFFESRRRGGAQYWRGYWALVLASGFAVIGYALYPVAPPRLVPQIDIDDVMSAYAYAGWWGNAASAPHGLGDMTNQFAAMPSMHFGWALWCAVQMWGFRTRVWRLLAVAYPALVAVAVVATGNHYVLDVAAGGACVVLAYSIVYWLQVRLARRSSTREATSEPRPDAPPPPSGAEPDQAAVLTDRGDVARPMSEAGVGTSQADHWTHGRVSCSDHH